MHIFIYDHRHIEGVAINIFISKIAFNNWFYDADFLFANFKKLQSDF